MQQGFTFTPPSGPPREGHKSKLALFCITTRNALTETQTMSLWMSTTAISGSKVCLLPQSPEVGSCFVFLVSFSPDPVMRACNGCRKRKIKCDAATTNTWPCSACLRLKLVCVPPTVHQDGDQPDLSLGSETEPANYPDPPPHPEMLQHGMVQQNMLSAPSPMQDQMTPYGAYASYMPQTSGLYAEAQPPQIAVTHHPFQDSFFDHVPPPQPLPTADSGVFIDPDQSNPADLSDALGELKIDETGIGEPSSTYGQ